MRRFLEFALLCAALLAASPGIAEPPPLVAPPPPVAQAPAPPEEETTADGEEAAVEEGVLDEPEGPTRAGYADTTGNLENLDDTDGLRVSIRSGALRAKRGYTPLEVTLHNTDNVPRLVRLSFQGYGSGSATTEREVELAPRQRLTTHLLIPAPVQSGLFSVSGPNLRQRSSGVYLDEGSSLSTLVLGTARLFEAGTSMARAEDSKPPQVNTRFLPVQDAPRELAAYVGYPVVMVADDVASVPADVWAALENYVAVGGALIVARPPRDVRQRLPMLSRELEHNAWSAYGFGQVFLCQTGAADCATALVSVHEDGKPPLEPIGPPPRWENNRFALQGGEMPLLPNALVPVGRFLVLIFLFSLVVGPGGLILARRKGPVALLIGVPAVALVTCLIIVGNSILVDGFVTHGARYSYTWLDRPRDRAVTAAVSGYYANLAADKVQIPGSGVLLAPQALEEWLVDVSWKNGGMVADGFLPARSYLEWGELAVVPTRARLVVRRDEGVLKVQNALGAPLKAGCLLYHEKRYLLPELADGAEGVATEVAADSKTGWDFSDVLHPPSGMSHRAKGGGTDFLRPLEDGGFVARLGGVGFGPLGTLKLQLHEGIHLVRGQVDGP